MCLEQQAPLSYANEHGAFGDADHQSVFPMVIDANVLRDEALRTLRSEQRTIYFGGELQARYRAHGLAR